MLDIYFGFDWGRSLYVRPGSGKVDGGAYGRELLRVRLELAMLLLLVRTGTAGIGMVGTSGSESWPLAQTGTRHDVCVGWYRCLGAKSWYSVGRDRRLEAVLGFSVVQMGEGSRSVLLWWFPMGRRSRRQG